MSQISMQTFTVQLWIRCDLWGLGLPPIGGDDLAPAKRLLNHLRARQTRLPYPPMPSRNWLISHEDGKGMIEGNSQF